uniref:PCI domain-containing protein n=1 Tax=Anopheles epiroticus TaxID=199890 RepID=A0A182P5V9_9DIPT
MPNIEELQDGPHANYYNTLNLFAYGTYRQYLENQPELIQLSPAMQKKLQHLTVVSLAIKSKCIPYNELLDELDIKNVRVLEDLIIEAIYADVIHGKLDQKNKQLEVDYAIGRDIRKGDVKEIASTLQEWSDSCETTLLCLETQINRANTEKQKRIKHKEAIDQEIANLKKAIKTQAVESDEAMATDTCRDIVGGLDLRKKPSKSKSLKGSDVNQIAWIIRVISVSAEWLIWVLAIGIWSHFEQGRYCIDTESCYASFQPEAHYVLHCFYHCRVSII